MTKPIIENVDLALTVQPTDTATFDVIDRAGRTGIAIKVMAGPDGPRLFVIVSTVLGVVGAALDEAGAETFGIAFADARLHLAAGDVGGRRN